MLDLFQIGKKSKSDGCQGLGPIIKLIKKGLLPIVWIIIPIILIALGTIDLGKAVIASNEEAVKKAQGMLIKRAIYAAAIFFVVTIVTVLMNTISDAAADADSDTNSWSYCWSNVK